MIVIGLCGGSGSGKGAACACFAQHGIPAIDTDAVYRELTSSDSECLREIRSEFGESVISGGSLDRRALADIVFSGEGSHTRLDRLNSIAHNHILARTRELLAEYSQKGAKAAIVDAPVLFESGFDSECDLVIAVVADREERIKRIMARDNISSSEAVRRIEAQKSDEWLSEHSDFVIVNNGDIDALSREVSSVLKKIINN